MLDIAEGYGPAIAELAGEDTELMATVVVSEGDAPGQEFVTTQILGVLLLLWCYIIFI